jgi:hypothetical protein
VHKRTPATTPAVDLNHLITSLSIDSFLDPIEINSNQKELNNERECSLEKMSQQNISTVDLTKTLPTRSKKKVSVTRSFSYNIGRLAGPKNINQSSNELNDIVSTEGNNLSKKIEMTSNDPIKSLDSPTSPVRSTKKLSLTSINDITGKAKSYAETTNFKLVNTCNPIGNGNINNMQGSLSQNFLANNHYNLNSKSSDKVYSIAGTINSATANSTSAVNKINKNDSLFGIILIFDKLNPSG